MSLSFLIGMLLSTVFSSCNSAEELSNPTTSTAPNTTQSETCEITSTSTNQVCMYVEDGQRIILSNSIPDHATGDFPNPNNPNRISAQSYHFEITTTPTMANKTTPVWEGLPGFGQMPTIYRFGIATNGILYDPGAAEFWENPRTGQLNGDWQEEAINANLGTDFNNAHVQPTGAYHYHGIPTSLVAEEKGAAHSKLYGYAADGFPIYYKYVYSDPENPNSPIVAMTSSYHIKEGERPGDGVSAPDGKYDGTYVQDFEFIEDQGTLDECNGRYGITPEYPSGTYYYVITDDYPWIPRCFVGTPSEDFRLGR